MGRNLLGWLAGYNEFTNQVLIAFALHIVPFRHRKLMTRSLLFARFVFVSAIVPIHCGPQFKSAHLFLCFMSRSQY